MDVSPSIDFLSLCPQQLPISNKVNDYGTFGICADAQAPFSLTQISKHGCEHCLVLGVQITWLSLFLPGTF